MNKIIYKIKWGLRRRLGRITRRHPTSSPFISGDSFRSLANYIYETGNKKIKSEKIKSGDIVFVASPLIYEFFTKVHPLIKKRYRLITHNGDDLIDKKLINKIDDKIINWYAMSVISPHPKIVPLPAGLENLSHYHNGIKELFTKYQKIKPHKKNRILFGFSISTNPKERQPAFDILIKSQVTDQIKSWVDPEQYLNLLNNYKFVAAPPGNAIESHRLWEALYLNVVPIVKKSYMMESFYQLGLPIWLVDKWTELNQLTEEDLAEKYTELMARSNMDPLYLNYWLNMIKNG